MYTRICSAIGRACSVMIAVMGTVALPVLLATAVTVGYDEQAMAQVPCNQDTEIHIPLNYHHFVPPAKGQSYTDQTYCRTIKRLTDSTNPGASNTSDFITAEYATQNHFNADETKIFVNFQGRDANGFNKANVQIIDPQNGNLLCDLPTVGVERMWSRTDPNILYFLSNNELRKANVGSCTEDPTPVHVFSEYASISGTGESDISPNGDRFVFVGINALGVATHVFVYTISTNTKGTTLDISTSQLDWAHITDGFVVLGFVNFQGGGQRVRVYNHNMEFQRELTQYISHEDVGVYWTGNPADQPYDVIYLVAYDPNNNCDNSIFKIRLSDGQRTCLKLGNPALDWSLAVHIAAPSQPSPWVYISTYDSSNPNPDQGQWKPYTNEVVRILGDGSGTIERWAHHHSRPFPGNDYYWTPRASVNKDGTKVLFSSTYGLHYKAADCTCTVAVEYTDTYLLTFGSTAQSVVWTNLVNVTVTGNSIQKTAGCDGCEDAGAASQQQIVSGNGYIEFTAGPANTMRSAGLGTGNTNTSRGDIEYAISLWGDGTAEVYENDVWEAALGSYQASTVFRVAIEGGVVKYYNGGLLVHSHTITPTYPYRLDTSLWSSSATINNAVISGNLSP